MPKVTLNRGNPFCGMSESIYLSIGSNLGARRRLIERSVRAIEETGRFKIDSSSAMRLTAPKEKARGQSWFFNVALKLTPTTPIEPSAALALFKGIERSMGRFDSGESQGPRPIDIDIIFFGTRAVEERTLKIPHPRAHRRRFVLEPLSEIEPSLIHPTLNASIAELLAALPLNGSKARKIVLLRGTT